MRQRKTIIGLAILVAVLIRGVGYASITGISLTIGGDASVAEVDLDVKFTNVTTSPGTTNATVDAEITSDTTATIDVTDLERVGDEVTATYTIKNNETDLSATLAVPEVVVSNTTYFEVTTDMTAARTLAAQATTTVTVTVRVKKTPVLSTDDTTTITVSIDAEPVNS